MQTGVNVRLEIGDDVSTDGSQELIKAKWNGDMRVNLHAWQEGSGSAGGNFRRLFRMIDTSQADFVALADQDDIWQPDKLSAAIQALQAGGADGYSCAVRAFWPNGREKLLSQQPTTRTADFLFEGAGQGCTFVMRAEIFGRVQQFCRDQIKLTESLHYHDWLIYLLVRSWAGRWHFDPNPHMLYRQHDGNEIGSRGSLAAVRRRLGMIRGGWYAEQIRAAARLYIQAGGQHPDALRLAACATQECSSQETRLSLAVDLLRFGRRRLSDRCILVFSVLAGWIF